MGYSLLIAYLYQSDEGCEYGVFLLTVVSAEGQHLVLIEETTRKNSH